jgi:hypothetical protein
VLPEVLGGIDLKDEGATFINQGGEKISHVYLFGAGFDLELICELVEVL